MQLCDIYWPYVFFLWFVGLYWPYLRFYSFFFPLVIFVSSLKNKEISGTLSSDKFIMPCISWHFNYMTTRFIQMKEAVIKELGGLSLFWIIDCLLSVLLRCIITDSFSIDSCLLRNILYKAALLKSSKLENAFNLEKCHAFTLVVI